MAARQYGPKRRPGVYNLQTIFGDHDIVGHLIVDSTNRWLNAEEIHLILANEDSLAISTPVPRNGVHGLFLYDIPAYRDHGIWQNHGLGARRGIKHNGCLIKQAESIGLLNDQYIKRVYRNFDRFGEIALVHYRYV